MQKEEITIYMLEVKYIELHEKEVPDKRYLYPYGWNKIHEIEIKTKMLAEALQKGILLHETEEYIRYCESVTETLHK